jgi:hypothetical protein
MVEESLLTPELRSWIGRETEAVSVRVTRRAVERALDVYYGARPGRLAPGDPVPGVVLAALEPEADHLFVPQPLPDTLLISNEWEYERPLRLEEELTARTRMADISERFGGRFGYSLYVRTDVEFRDAAGALVARAARTMMHYDASSARGGGDDGE